MNAIDADSHFVEPLDWLSRVDRALFERVGATMSLRELGELITVREVTEMFSALPPPLRPTVAQLAPRGVDALLERLGVELHSEDPNQRIGLSQLQQGLRDSALGAILWPQGAVDPAERLEFCDARGIGLQFVNPTFLVRMLRQLGEREPQLLRPVMEAYNSWAAQVLAGRLDRFIPVTYLRLDDVEWCCRELQRMRRLGSRAFVFPFEPVNGRSLADPALEPLWHTATELQMLAFLHVGVCRPPLDPAWASQGGRLNLELAIRLILNQNHVCPQLPLSSLVLAGVFDRHPRLTVIAQEFGISWVGSWAQSIGFNRFEGLFAELFSAWPCQRPAREYLCRNILVSPLPHENVPAFMREHGDGVAVFATDYPHPEGAESARADYQAAFSREGVPASAQARFFCENMLAAMNR